MARTRSATYDDQRDAILARAAELFANQGYTATSMNDIAAACGMSKAGLYHYYRDKRELLFQITVGHVGAAGAVRRRGDAGDAATPTAETRLRALILRFVREYADAQNEHRVLTEDVRFLEDAERARCRSRSAAWSPRSPTRSPRCARTSRATSSTARSRCCCSA